MSASSMSKSRSWIQWTLASGYETVLDSDRRISASYGIVPMCVTTPYGEKFSVEQLAHFNLCIYGMTSSSLSLESVAHNEHDKCRLCENVLGAKVQQADCEFWREFVSQPVQCSVGSRRAAAGAEFFMRIRGVGSLPCRCR